MGRTAWLYALALSATCASAQSCYDLNTTRLYRAEGRFKEWWKDHDFKLDKSEFGDASQFAAFSLGVIRKNGSGWEPARAARYPKTYCDWPGPKGTSHCYTEPFDHPSKAADLRPSDSYSDVETWDLSADGMVTYRRRSDVFDGPGHEHGGFQVQARLDLNTGEYAVEIHGHAVGIHRHIDPKGIELWRESPFHAVAKLTPAACPAKAAKVSLEKPVQREITDAGPCVVRTGTWEFILNPRADKSPAGCVAVSTQPAPEPAPKQGRAQ